MNYAIPMHKYKTLYLQIPKSANTSICSIIGSINGWFDKPIEDMSPQELHRVVNKHKFKLNERNMSKYKDYFIFSFVRNPYDRALSCWNDKVENRNNFRGFKNYSLPKGISFLEYSKRISKITDKNSEIHFTSQHYLASLNNKIFLDNFWKIEDPEAWSEFKKIMSNKGLTIPDIPPHRNKVDHRHYTEYYCKKSQNLIYDRYKIDFEYFGYSKELR